MTRRRPSLRRRVVNGLDDIVDFHRHVIIKDNEDFDLALRYLRLLVAWAREKHPEWK